MYLIQEQQLKTGQPSSIFFRLPPITALSVANSRLLWLGFALFTVGLTTGFLIGASDRLDAGGMVDRCLVRLRRYPDCPSSARHGGQMGCDPVDRRI